MAQGVAHYRLTFLKHVWRTSFGKIKFENNGNNDDNTPANEQSMNAVNGKSCKLTQTFLDDIRAPFEVEVFVLATESVRILTLFS